VRAGGAAAVDSWLSRVLLSDTFILAAMLAGWLLRLHWYLFDRSLRWDEAALALNILHRPPWALFGPLDNDQAAPVGFLLAVQLVTSLLGSGERILRLVPFVAGIVSVPLCYAVARRYVSRHAVPVVLGLFAVNPWLVYWSSECKQYMPDVLLTLVGLLTAGWLLEHGLADRRALLLGLFGGLSVFCSFAMVFVLPAIGVALAWTAVSRGDRPLLRKVTAIAVAWLAGFLVYYVTTLRQLGHNLLLQSFWSARFLSATDFSRDYGLLSSLFVMPADLAAIHPWPVGLVFLAGCVVLSGRSPIRAAVLLCPALCVACASLFGRYPLWNRMVLFLAPVLLLLTVEGIVGVARRVASFSRLLGAATAAVMVAGVAYPAVGEILKGPEPFEEVRPLLTYLRQHVERGDRIYVGELAPVYEYYRHRAGLQDLPYVAGRYLNREWERTDDQVLDRMKGFRRVWTMSSDEDFRRRLDPRGRRLDSVGDPEDVMLYLYDFSSQP
jgi:uncharacterized membrane protein